MPAMIGTRNSVNFAMRVMPPKMTRAVRTQRKMAVNRGSMPNAVLADSAIVLAWTET